MAGGLPKNPAEFHRITGAKTAIIAGSWHTHCVRPMIERCLTELEGTGIPRREIPVHLLPGCNELPLAAEILFEKDPGLDALIAFGVVLTGITSHDQTVLMQVVNGFGRVSERFKKPVINEVIGVSDIRDAEKRSSNDSSNKGVEAAYALSEYIHWRRSLG